MQFYYMYIIIMSPNIIIKIADKKPIVQPHWVFPQISLTTQILIMWSIYTVLQYAITISLIYIYYKYVYDFLFYVSNMAWSINLLTTFILLAQWVKHLYKDPPMMSQMKPDLALTRI